MTTNKGRGRSRKASPIRRLTDGMKKAIVYLICVSLIGTSMLSSSVFADVDEDESSFDPGDVIVYLDNDGSVETASNAVRPGGSGGGSGNSAVNNSIITIDEVESAANALKTSDTVTYQESAGGVIVTVEAPEGALPDGAELIVERYDEESEDYEAAALAIKYEETVTEFSLLHVVDPEEDTDEDEADETAEPVINMAALDIHFEAGSEEIEPDRPVKVSIDISNLIPEDAILDSLEVQHLVEDGEDTEAVVVADETAKTDGIVDLEAGVVEFEVENFSTFTVTWKWTEQSGETSSVSLTVTAYLDGVEINGLEDIEFDSQDDELNLETMLNEEHFGTSDYTFSWAYVTYERTQGQTTQTTTIGSIDDSVEAIEKTSGGQSSFIVIQKSGTSTTVQSSYNLHLYAYYVTPTFSVEITAVAEDDAEDWLLQATLSHAGDYTSVSYEWSVTGTDGSETSLAKVSWDDETGRAFIVWSEDIQNFDEVVVHVKVTLDGDETKTAEASYTLEYGDEYVNIQMTYGPDNTVLGAGVTVTLTNTVTGQTYTGTTDDNGQILGLEIEPGIYTVEASTTIDGSNYSCSETVSMADAATYSINLNYADAEKTSDGLDMDKTDWNHVDIKLSTGTTGSGVSSEGVTVNITGVVITGENENGETVIKYTADSTSIAAGASDNEWQIYFYTGTNISGSYSHTIEFATTDSITIIYTLQWEDSDEPETYTVTIDYSSVYSVGTTYPSNGQRAFKLYNYLYGTNYSSNAQLMAAGVDSIDIGEMSMMLVAAILCDSSVTGNGAGVVTGTAGMWGMDFALSVEGFVSLSTAWMFDLEKTYENHAMTAGMFTFTLDDATVDESGIWTEQEGVGSGWEYTWSNSTVGKGIDGNSSDTMSGIYIPYDDEEIQEGVTYYYILSESAGDAAYTTYDDTVFGAKVCVHTDDDATSQTNGEAVVEVTYYTLTAVEGEDDKYTATEYSGEKITLGDNNYPTFHFVNTYSTDVKISKQDEYGNTLSGAEFMLTQAVILPETSDDATHYFYYDPKSADDPWTEYELGSNDVTFAQFELVDLTLETPYDGTYTLTEVSAPAGWQTLPAAIEFTVEERLIVPGSLKWAESYDGSEKIEDYVTISKDNLTLTMADKDTTTQVTVTKEWKDNDNKDGKRPEYVEIQMTADNVAYGDAVTLNDENEWNYTWENLPVHNSEGKEVEYSVEEPIVSDGYSSIVGELTPNEYGTAYTITVTNSYYREYYPIDEEIVTDTDDIFDRDAWVKRESVNEYNAIEFEMTTNLPKMDAKAVEDGDFVLTFHDQLDSELNLDEVDTDFSVYIDEIKIDHEYYTITLRSAEASPASISLMIKALSESNGTEDDCAFHVDVDLTALYNAGVVTEDMLEGNTEITIFFFADLEGTGLNGSYKSTVWYDVYDGDEWQYTSNVDVVEVYTYEIEIQKYDIETGASLAGATFGVYYDGDCTDSVSRNNEEYKETSDEDGMVIFYGLADGTYYVKELEAPTEYVLSDEVLEVLLGENLNDNGYAYETKFGNTPEESEPSPDPNPATVNVSGSKTWIDDDNANDTRPESITIHLLADGVEVDSKKVTSEDEWKWDFTDLPEYDGDVKITYTIAEDIVADYSTEINGYDVTNTYTPGKTAINVQKIWNDSGDKDKKRPTDITVTLVENGVETDQTLTLDESSRWAGSFKDLDASNEYSVVETGVSDYSTEINPINGTSTINVTNIHTPESNDGNDGNNGNSGSGGGGGYSGSGSSHNNSSTSGPGAESTAHESSGGGDSSGNSIGTDNIGGLPQTGEGSMAMILISVCVVLIAVLAVLFHIRRRTTKGRE